MFSCNLLYHHLKDITSVYCLVDNGRENVAQTIQPGYTIQSAYNTLVAKIHPPFCVKRGRSFSCSATLLKQLH
jgi:hypothetical protein